MQVAQKPPGNFPGGSLLLRETEGLRLHVRLDGFGRDRQRADARAAGVEDRIAERRRDHGERRLADAGRLVAVGDDFRHTTFVPSSLAAIGVDRRSDKLRKPASEFFGEVPATLSVLPTSRNDEACPSGR